MFRGSEGSALSRRTLISFFLLCQLTWIVPCIFFLLHPSPAAPTLSIMQTQNASGRIHAKGVAGPFKVLGSEDVTSLKTIHEKWSTLWPTLRDRALAKGFSAPPERTCFIWLPECYNFATHEQITQIVKEVIGPNVLLYGMTIWDGENEGLQQYDEVIHTHGCVNSVSLVSGISVQVLNPPYNFTERLKDADFRSLRLAHEEAMNCSSADNRKMILRKLLLEMVERLLSTGELHLESFDGAHGDGVFIRGDALFQVGKVMEGRRGLLMQFISAECTVREQRHHLWGMQGTSHVLYMPPLLLVAGAMSESSRFNDVRLGVVKEAMKVKAGRSMVLGSSLEGEKKASRSPRVDDIVVLSVVNESVHWQKRGIWRFQKVGEVSTTLMPLGRVEHFQLSKNLSTTEFYRVAGKGKQVIVVLGEGLHYARWVINGEDLPYSEVLELTPGSAVLLSPQFLHALKPLKPDSAFMSFSWLSHEDKEPFKKTRPDDQFQMLGFKEEDFLAEELLGHGTTKATDGRSFILNSGQAYDPDEVENCDALVFVIEGSLLQVLPYNVFLQSMDVLLVPAEQSCVLWNAGDKFVRLFAMHLCHFDDIMQIAKSFGAIGDLF